MIDSDYRLRCWIEDYGQEKSPAFIEDLRYVLDELRRLRNALEDVLDCESSRGMYDTAKRALEKGGKENE